MFNTKAPYSRQLPRESTEVGEVLTDRLHDLSKPAEKQAGALEAEVRPNRKRPLLRLLGWAALLLPAFVAVGYGVRRYLQADKRMASPFSPQVSDYYSPSGSQLTTSNRDDKQEPEAVIVRDAPVVEAEESISRSTDQVEFKDGNVERNFESLLGKEVVDLNSNSVGEARGVYYRAGSGEPEWVLVVRGLIEKEIRPAPLDGASIGEKIQLACEEDLVKSAPDLGEVLTLEDEMMLYEHFNVRRSLPDDTATLENDPLKRWIAVPEIDAADYGTLAEDKAEINSRNLDRPAL